MVVQRSVSGSIAEDLFIELFSEAFGAEKAGYLYSQYHFYDIYQNSRYADFLLESNGRKVAIEIEDGAAEEFEPEVGTGLIGVLRTNGLCKAGSQRGD